MYPKISIIIPVYNSERFLSSCLDSILKQSLSEIEIICVDDMSTDNSKHILNQYSLLDDRIKIYSHDKNRGPGAARNTGIKYATGEYLGFIDSDDIPDKNFFKELYKIAIENNADIAKGLYKNMETGECSELINIKIKGNKNYFFGEFCSAIFLASLVKKNKIFFPERYDLEDPVFSLLCSVYANKIVVTENVFVTIHNRDDSISTFSNYNTSKNKKKIIDRILGYKDLYNIVNEYNISNVVLGFMLASYISQIFSNVELFNLETKLFFAKKFNMFWSAIAPKDRNTIISYIGNSTLKHVLLENSEESFFYFDIKSKLDEISESNQILEEYTKDYKIKLNNNIIIDNTYNIDIVSVVNDFNIYNVCIANNHFLKNRKNIQLVVIDNSKNNKFISVRYNEYINKIQDEKWILFCHSDWELEEDIIPRLKELDPNCLYGPIGAKYQAAYEDKDIICIMDKNIIGSCSERLRDGSRLRKIGTLSHTNSLVDTFDCQALLVHSSLIKRYNLKFDENLPFDLYVEDFCISAHLNHGIESHIIRLKCCHWSGYHATPPSYFSALQYLNNKYEKFLFAGTVSFIGKKEYRICLTIEEALKEIRKRVKKCLI